MQPIPGIAGTAAHARYEMAAGVPFALLDHNAQSLAEVAHDARNMVTALGLYCELLEEPGVLSADYRHYGSELKLLATASRRLVDKLLSLNTTQTHGEAEFRIPPSATLGDQRPSDWGTLPDTPIGDLAFELESNRNLLNALAGRGIELSLTIAGCALPVRLTSEDLTRILVNLLKNAVEAMPAGGRLHLSLGEAPTGPREDQRLLLTIEDNGPGIDPDRLEQVFEPGYSTHARTLAGEPRWAGDHLGLGLSITRSIIEAAGGRIYAASRDPAGTCFQIDLPVRTC